MNPEKWVFDAILLLLVLFFGLGNSIDTITPTRPIKDGDVLVSNGETFALGFFSTKNGTSNRRYVGIWYNKISEQIVVWVANRDNPINGSSGAISINQDGNLVIYEHNSQNNVTTTLWKTNVSTSSSSYSARLLDSGNLMLLFQGGDTNNGSVVVWQSFDYPTHTMLPNMKLGLDWRTGLNRFLTSWKSNDDSGTGEYSFRRDHRGLPQSFLLKGSGPTSQYWRTGPWMGDKWSGTPELPLNYIFNVSYVDSNEEFSVMYGLTNASIMSMMFLDESGYLQRSTWHEDSARWVVFWSAPKEPCDYYGRCGPYGNCDPINGQEFECLSFMFCAKKNEQL